MKDAKKYLKISLTPDLEEALDQLRKTGKGNSTSKILRDLIALGIETAMKDAITKDEK